MSVSTSEAGKLVTPDQTGVLPYEIKFPSDKVIADLQQGFRITTTDPGFTNAGMVSVITRFEDDYFSLDANNSNMESDEFVNSYSRFQATIRRRKKIPMSPGSATLERWRLNGTTRRPMEEDYRIQPDNGGSLTQEEFLRRYNASIVDHEATAELYARRKLEFETARRGRRRASFKINWIRDEDQGFSLSRISPGSS